MLFKTKEELQQYLSISQSTSLPVLAPFIREVERTYIIPLLGRAQYDELDAAYQAAAADLSGMAANLKELLPQVQAPLARLALHFGLPELQANISDAGVGDETGKPVRQWQFDDVVASLGEKGFSGLDGLLEFLEENKADYATWTSSSSYSVTRQFIINTAKEISIYCNIPPSRRAFLQLWPIMRKIEDFDITAAIGEDLLAEIKAQILTDTLSEDNEQLMKSLKPAVANLTLARAILELPAQYTHEGIMINTYKAINENSREKNPAPDQRLSAARTVAETDGRAYLARLVNYLNQNAAADKYAAYYNSGLYVDPTDTTTPTSYNSENGNFYRF